MDNNDHKNTWEGFTKVCSLGNNCSHSYSSNFSYYFTIKFVMIIGSTKEDLSIEKEFL